MPKYNAKSIVVDGIRFDSMIEAQFYQENKDQIISIQPVFLLQEGFVKHGKKRQPITYKADFTMDNGDVIDIKGMATEVANIKRKMFDYARPSLTLKRIAYVKKYGGWVDYDDLLKLRKNAKVHKSVSDE